jgi:uncharacterized membrane protein
MKSTLTWTWRGITATFLAGLFAVLPLVITVAIVGWVVKFINDIVGPQSLVGRGLGSLGKHFAEDSIVAQLIGWAIVLGAIFLIGVLVRMKLQSTGGRWLDAVFQRIPLVGSVYGTAAQFVGMLNKQDKSDLAGMTVVMCQFGEAGGCGILCLMPSPEKYRFGERDYQAVYIPTSPVPMTGGLIFVPVEAITVLDMTVDKLMSIYLSMGVTAPTMMSCRVAALAAASLPTDAKLVQ